MTGLESCETLNECSVSAVRDLAAHLGVDPVGLSERAKEGALIKAFDALETMESYAGQYVNRPGYQLSGQEKVVWDAVTAALASLRGDQLRSAGK